MTPGDISSTALSQAGDGAHADLSSSARNLPGDTFRRWLPFLVLGALWFWLFNNLRLEWSVNDQYSYGFAVPPLALYLFWQRWRTAPPTSAPPFPNAILGAIAAVSLLVFPLQLVQEANPEWRFVSWCMTGVVVGISLGMMLFRAGLPWAKHFVFPICFIFTAVPWSSKFEASITQLLMRVDASIAVEMLKWCGIPAIQKGNVIDLGTCLVGVSEACSGIRSLQNTLMISLFLGELYRLGLFRRILLVMFAAGIAFLCNLGRTFFLAWLSAEKGNAVMEKWHDGAGLAVLMVTLAALMGLSFALRGKPVADDAVATPASTGATRFRSWPFGFLVALGSWLILVAGASEAWYRAHEIGSPRAKMWSIRWPSEQPGFRDDPVADSTRALLKYTEGRRASWSGGGSAQWAAFFFRWAPGRTARIAARWHQPDVCLPATGRRLVADKGIRVFDVQGIAIPFHWFVFDESGRTLHVWQCLWDDDTSRARGFAAAQANENVPLLANRLDAVWRARRNLGQQVLEVAVWGVSNPGEAQSAFENLLGSIIQL